MRVFLPLSRKSTTINRNIVDRLRTCTVLVSLSSLSKKKFYLPLFLHVRSDAKSRPTLKPECRPPGCTVLEGSTGASCHFLLRPLLLGSDHYGVFLLCLLRPVCEGLFYFTKCLSIVSSLSPSEH